MQLRNLSSGLDLQLIEQSRISIDREIESLELLMRKMYENIVECAVEGELYRLLKAMQELHAVSGITEIT